MEPIFTLPYSEFAVAKELSKYFKKNDGYSISIPMSRQQKGFDIIIYNQKTKRAITFQVKSSRTYEKGLSKRKLKYERFKFYTWFNAFDIEKGNSDYYILFGVYTKLSSRTKFDKSKKISKWYSHILLLLTEKEMIKFLGKLTTKNKKEKDSKFSFGFNDENKIYLTRGASKQPDISKYLFSKRINNILKRLNH